MTESEMKVLSDMLAREIGVVMEDVQHKLDLLVEGHQLLAEKIDRVDEKLTTRIDRVATTLDTVAGDLEAHRRDTEAHRGVYRVREPE